MYQERYIAFIDILGFKETVEKTYKSETEFNRLRTAIQHIEFLRTINYTSPLGAEFTQMEFSMFSDSIVISYPDGDAFWILNEISSLCEDLISMGYIFRGGITFGPLIHEGQICYGPAMNKAAELEKLACYPRIIVEPVVIVQGLKHPIISSDIDEEEQYIKKYLKSDEDFMFLDYLGCRKTTMTEAHYVSFLGNVRKLILSAYIDVSNKIQICSEDSTEKLERVREKYIWFSKYYNSTVEEKLSNQELLIDLANL